MTVNAVALIYLFKDKNLHHSHLQCKLQLPDYNQCKSLEMENSLSTPHLDRLFIQWNNAVYQMNCWVHTAGRYRGTSILRRLHAAFFNSHQIEAMIYIPDEVVLERIMTALDLEFKKAMHYHDEGYESDDYGLLPQVMRPGHIYSVFTNEASFNLVEYKVTPHTISPIHTQITQKPAIP